MNGDTPAPFWYASGMRRAILGLVGLWILSVGCCGSPALLGSQFADAYAAFAPLYVLHRSYAEYLFNGTAVEIPADLEQVILNCLEKNPTDRPPSARHLCDMLCKCSLNGDWTQEQASAWWVKREKKTDPSIDVTHF